MTKPLEAKHIGELIPPATNILVMQMDKNYNQKLDCDAFTDIRLKKDQYRIGAHFFVRTKDKDYGLHYIADVREFLLDAINEFIARLDTGLSKEECIALIKKIYETEVTDWSQQKIYLLLMVKVPKT